MRRRLRFATISAVLAAVVFLGIPLGLATAQSVRNDALADLQFRTETAASILSARIERGEPVNIDVLADYVGGSSEPEAFIAVEFPSESVDPRYPAGIVLSAGVEASSEFSHTVTTEAGMVVTIAISQFDVVLRAVERVSLVVGAAFGAVIVGAVLASWHANRLSRPLQDLAVVAEQMGAGRVPPHIDTSGVDEIDQVADELRRSSERMAARLEAERQFSSDASHQLRTPLTALTMRLEEIHARTSSPEVRTEAEQGLEQVERLVGVIDDLLGRTRTSVGGTTESVPLSALFDKQQEEWSRSFENAGRTLVVTSTDAQVFASPGGLSQVLATLIENSLIHGEGTTRVDARDQGENSVVISVADEGPGVPESLQGKIFDRNVTSGRGTGLGLALARDLVTADGGRLELTQRRPAVFSVFLQGVPESYDAQAADVVPHTGRMSLRRRKR